MEKWAYFTFPLELGAYAETPEEAWEMALEGLFQDPGAMPEPKIDEELTASFRGDDDEYPYEKD